jgi:hypothetical protein
MGYLFFLLFSMLYLIMTKRFTDFYPLLARLIKEIFVMIKNTCGFPDERVAGQYVVNCIKDNIENNLQHLK